MWTFAREPRASNVVQSSWWYKGKTRSHRPLHTNPWRIRICLSGLIRSWRICHVTVLFRKSWLHHSSMNWDTLRRDRKPNLYQTRIRITHRFPQNIFGRWPSGLKTNQLWNVARNISFQLSRFHSAVFGLFNLFILRVGRVMYFEKRDKQATWIAFHICTCTGSLDSQVFQLGFIFAILRLDDSLSAHDASKVCHEVRQIFNLPYRNMRLGVSWITPNFAALVAPCFTQENYIE